MTDRMLGLRVFDTDGAGVDEPFKWIGGGVADSSDGHSMDWQPSVWYKIEGYVDEETGEAEAMIWPTTDSRPEEYQISATVETGVSDPLPYAVRVAGRRGYKITMDLAHLYWNAVENDR
ncbi:hypothetical protein BVU17_18430 (plasmid) [Haloarcula taiwanensis]|uniref:Uncharacterized protein n=2 Tax=Haloarcula TaxID=2237 RepID=A0A2H5A482_9EURY|nr:hypothetical protein BVU17_18430 [Haloarcula taiwanensis]